MTDITIHTEQVEHRVRVRDINNRYIESFIYSEEALAEYERNHPNSKYEYVDIHVIRIQFSNMNVELTNAVHDYFRQCYAPNEQSRFISLNGSLYHEYTYEYSNMKIVDHGSRGIDVTISTGRNVPIRINQLYTILTERGTIIC